MKNILFSSIILVLFIAASCDSPKGEIILSGFAQPYYVNFDVDFIDMDTESAGCTITNTGMVKITFAKFILACKKDGVDLNIKATYSDPPLEPGEESVLLPFTNFSDNFPVSGPFTDYEGIISQREVSVAFLEQGADSFDETFSLGLLASVTAEMKTGSTPYYGAPFADFTLKNQNNRDLLFDITFEVNLVDGSSYESIITSHKGGDTINSGESLEFHTALSPDPDGGYQWNGVQVEDVNIMNAAFSTVDGWTYTIVRF